MRKVKKVLKWIVIVLAALILIEVLVIVIGKMINRRIPDGGINETLFADINGTKQWISIYSENKDNPVLLYLHGGPCSATSASDWTALHKLAKDYTVVNWDQRGCGHNYPDYKESAALTPEIMMQDGAALTDYLRERFGKEKITLLGFSWGSVLGSNLVLESPEKYDAMIALSLVVDVQESQTLFKEYMLEKTANDPELHKIAEELDPADWSKATMTKTWPLTAKYSHIDNYLKESDVNFLTTVLFNPYCTLPEAYRMIYGTNAYRAYMDVLMPEPASLVEPLGLSGKTAYQVPFYLMEGDEDFGNVTMWTAAKAYFEAVSAPDKEMVTVSGGHNAPMMQSEKLAEFVHSIAAKQK